MESNRFIVDCVSSVGLTFSSRFGWDSAGLTLVPPLPTVFCFFLSSSRAAFSASSRSRRIWARLFLSATCPATKSRSCAGRSRSSSSGVPVQQSGIVKLAFSPSFIRFGTTEGVRCWSSAFETISMSVRSASMGMSWAKNPFDGRAVGVVMAGSPSERNVIIHSVIGGRRRTRRCVVPRPTWRRMLLITRVRRTAQEANPRRDNFHRSTRILVLIFVFPDLEAALHIYGISALQEFCAGGAEAIESYDSKPCGPLLRIAVAILPSLVHGDGEVHDMVAVIDVLHLGRPAQVPDNLHVV